VLFRSFSIFRPFYPIQSFPTPFSFFLFIVFFLLGGLHTLRLVSLSPSLILLSVILFGFVWVPDCFNFNHNLWLFSVAHTVVLPPLSHHTHFLNEPETLSIYHNYAIATAVLRGPPCTCRHPGLHESYLYHALLARMYTQTCCFRNQGTFVLFAPLKPTLDSPSYTLSMVIPLPSIS
jgi:hypothetical protein